MGPGRTIPSASAIDVYINYTNHVLHGLHNSKIIPKKDRDDGRSCFQIVYKGGCHRPEDGKPESEGKEKIDIKKEEAVR